MGIGLVFGSGLGAGVALGDFDGRGSLELGEDEGEVEVEVEGELEGDGDGDREDAMGYCSCVFVVFGSVRFDIEAQHSRGEKRRGEEMGEE